MAISIFVYNLAPAVPFLASKIYDQLSNIPDDKTNYFKLELLNENELSGEYIIVQTVEESFYNPIDRIFEQRKASKATVISFTICNNQLEIWGNKTNAGKLIFAISSATQNQISINAVNISIENIISKLQTYRVKISKVCFEDFLLSEDIVGNFTVDLSTYGDVFAVLNKYREKIARMTAILPCEGTSLKITFSSKGTVMVYKTRESFEDDMLDMLHAILLK